MQRMLVGICAAVLLSACAVRPNMEAPQVEAATRAHEACLRSEASRNVVATLDTDASAKAASTACYKHVMELDREYERQGVDAETRRYLRRTYENLGLESAQYYAVMTMRARPAGQPKQ